MIPSGTATSPLSGRRCSRYREQPDKYELRTDNFEGRVTLTSAYFTQLNKVEQDREYLDVSFGYPSLL